MFRALICLQSGLRYLRQSQLLSLPNLSSNSGGGGGVGADLLDYIGPELGVTPVLDPGTDLEDELPSPDVSPMAISHGVSLLPAQVEEDVDLAQILAEFGTLPAIVTPIHDPQEARVMYLWRRLGRLTMMGGRRCSPIALAAPAVPTLERNLFFPGQTQIGPPPGGETADYRLPPVPLPSCPATVSQPMGELDTLRERMNVPDLSREGPFDIHRDRLHSDASPRSCQDSQGCPFRITSYDLEIDGADFAPEYGVQLHDPRLLEYVGALESARLLSLSPEYWVQHMGREKTL